jgi:hypothetical protein
VQELAGWLHPHTEVVQVFLQLLHLRLPLSGGAGRFFA